MTFCSFLSSFIHFSFCNNKWLWHHLILLPCLLYFSAFTFGELTMYISLQDLLICILPSGNYISYIDHQETTFYQLISLLSFFSSVLFHSEFQNELFLVFHIRLKTNKNLSYLCLRLEKDLVKLVRKTVSLYTFFAVLAIAKRLFSC